MIDVMNLSDARIVTYDTDDPTEAVKLAFLQHERKNFNTWQYAEILPTLKTYNGGSLTVACGDWAAFKDGRRFPGRKFYRCDPEEKRSDPDYPVQHLSDFI